MLQFSLIEPDDERVWEDVRISGSVYGAVVVRPMSIVDV